MDFVKAASELRELLVAVEYAQHQIRALGKFIIQSYFVADQFIKSLYIYEYATGCQAIH